MYYGKIKFYDNRINHFGFITDIYSYTERISKDAFLNQQSLTFDEDKLCDYLEVFFEITDTKKGLQAKNVKLISQLTNDDYVEIISNFNDDGLKLTLLKYNPKFLTLVCTHWNFSREYYTTDLLELIKKNHLYKTELLAFTNILFERIEIVTIENALNYFSYLDDKNYLSKYFNLLNLTSIAVYNEIEKNIRRFFVSDKEVEGFECLIKNVKFENPEVNFQIKVKLLKLFIEYFSKPSYKELIPIALKNSKISSINDFISFCELSSLIKDVSFINTVTELYKISSINFSDPDRLSLLSQAEDNLISEILKSWDGSSDYYNDQLLNILISNDKYLNLKDVIKTILNKKFKISIREDYYSYNFNKSDYLAPYFQYVRKFKNHSFLKIINHRQSF